MIIMVALRWDLIYTTFMPQYYYLWVWLASGLTGAFLSFRYWDLGVTFAGAFGGFATAMGIIAAANLAIGNAIRYVILGIFVLGVAAIATFFERVFVILATSFGGAYMVMYGVDEFIQVGYREMIVVFDFTGKTLTYHPNRAVYLMLASSLVLASLGVVWEFWHHTTPVLMDRKAVFRIYGRPFGKRPKKLVGQKIHHHLRSRSELYTYIVSCGCFERRTIDDVLYDDDQCPQEVIQEPPPPTHAPNLGGEQNTTEGERVDPATKEPKVTTPTEDSNIPLKTVPIENVDEKGAGENQDDSTAVLALKDTMDSEKHDSVDTKEFQPTTNETTTSSNHQASSSMQPSTSTSTLPLLSASTLRHTEPQEERSNTEALNPEHVPEEFSPSPHSELFHPMFGSGMDTRAMDMLRFVADDTPGTTVLRDFLPQNYRTLVGPSAFPDWPSSTSLSDIGSSTTAVNRHGRHMLEFSESTQGTHGSEDSEEYTGHVHEQTDM
ncbi:hypothetical protein BGX28_004034 [Mortierella sp. GBA30]|nr:hypothetical protein BGX28_004034 [Mortierella sp. GBA30]